MTPFEAYCLYINLKNHFTQKDYDFIKYKGKSRLKPTSYEKRKDKLFFEKLAKHEDLIGFLVANFVVDPKQWVREIAYSENAERLYTEWLRKQQALTYTIKQELEDIDLKKDLKQGDESHPILFQKYLGKSVSLETLCVLLDLCDAIKLWDSYMEYDPVWEDEGLKVKKYLPFVKYDKEKVKKICLEKLR